MEKYPILNNGNVVGEVQMLQEGRMWKLFCVSQEETPLEILALWKGGTVEIGCCNRRGIVKRISMQNLGTEELQFVLMNKENRKYLERDTPVDSISDLRFVKLDYYGGRPFLTIDQESSSPTGQWSEPIISE